MSVNHAGNTISGLRCAVQVALDFIAAVFAQDIELMLVFHALGNDAQFEAVRKLYQSPDNLLGALIGGIR